MIKIPELKAILVVLGLIIVQPVNAELKPNSNLEVTTSGDPAKSDKDLSKDANYSGYYVFDGKMFRYDQETGEFTPTQGQENDKAKTEPESSMQTTDSFSNFAKKPRMLSMLGGYGQMGGSEPCQEWGSPFLEGKSYPRKDECDDELEKAIDKQLAMIDKYNESFEQKKWNLKIMVDSTYEENRKMNYKLDFSTSIKMLETVKKQGCVCTEK